MEAGSPIYLPSWLSSVKGNKCSDQPFKKVENASICDDLALVSLKGVLRAALLALRALMCEFNVLTTN